MARKSGERLTVEQRRRIAVAWNRGYDENDIARQMNVIPATVRRWIRRFEAEGYAGLQTRPCPPPARPPALTPEPIAQALREIAASEPGLSLCELARRGT